MVLKHHESIPPNLVDLLRHRAQQHHNDHAYAWISDADAPEQTVTYGEVDRASRAIAAMLMAEGATGQRALLLYPPGLEYIAAYFGCLYAGVIAVPAYPPRLNRPSPRLAAIVEDAQATFALTTTPILQKLQARFVDTPALAALTWHTTDGMDLQHADALHRMALGCHIGRRLCPSRLAASFAGGLPGQGAGALRSSKFQGNIPLALMG